MHRWLGVVGGGAFALSYILPWTIVPGVMTFTSSPKTYPFGWVVLVIGCGIVICGAAPSWREREGLRKGVENGLGTLPYLAIGFIVWRVAAVKLGIDVRPVVDVFPTGLASPQLTYGLWVATAGALFALASRAPQLRYVPKVVGTSAAVVVGVGAPAFAYSRML